MMHRQEVPMPATNPRLTITMQPSLAAILRRVSQLTGSSQSSIIGELLMQSMPIFERMVIVLDAAGKLKEQGEKMPKEIGESLDRAQERMESQLGLLLDDMDAGVRPLLQEAEKVHRRGARADGRSPAARATGARTPMSNRGVTPSPEKGRKAAAERKGGRHGPL
jgi:hypothetical protein